MENMKYKAVAVEELRATLGNQCSPMPAREGYVIGPDINGRLCHIATFFTFSEALQRAELLNNKGK